MSGASSAPTPAAPGPEWERIVQSVVSARPEVIRRVEESWNLPTSTGDRAIETLKSQLAILSTPDAKPDWTTGVSEDDRLKGGIYTPFQILLWRCAEGLGDSLEAEFPFLVGLVGLASRLTLESTKDEPQVAAWPPAGDADYRSIRRVFQSAFHLRELREEGEPLSLEIRLPASDADPPDLDLKRFAQVFGRGVGIAEGGGLSELSGPTGRLKWLWTNHEGAPVSTLYKLSKPYGKIPRGELRVILKRDGLLTVAADQNPLLEFYDGGWHVVDLTAGSALIDRLLERTFGAGQTESGLAQSIVSLAYHMATHWHPGILGVVREDQISTVLEDPSPETTNINQMIRQSMEALQLGQDRLRVTDMKDTGLGRVLLTCAIQDGATLFLPDGTLDSSARMLKQVAQHVTGGAGTRAAKKLSEIGVALKVSRDGAIRVFAGGPDSTILPPNGMRIR